MMARRLKSNAVFAACCLMSSSAVAQQGSTPSFDVPQSGVTVLTGDSWRQGAQLVRLYGIQACLRDTSYTDDAGKPQDCGAVSASMLAALLRDTTPRCRAVAQVAPSISAPSTTLVVCSAQIGSNMLDLGSMMISQGFAFAALDGTHRPVYPPYQALELLAGQARVGLWKFRDLPHPNSRLLK